MPLPRLPRNRSEDIEPIGARIWKSDVTKIRRLSASQEVTFSALFRAVVPAGIAAIEEELSQEPEIIGSTAIRDGKMMSHDETMKRAFDDQMNCIKRLVGDEILVNRLIGCSVWDEYINLLEELRATAKREMRKGTPFAEAAQILIGRMREFEMLLTDRSTPILYSQFN